MSIRIIPRLDIKGPNLVKGIHLEGLRVLGKPHLFARHYYEQGADELLYMDAVASLYERNSLLDIVERTAREIFIPLTVGGGLRTTEDIRHVLLAGADKVALNTAAIKNPSLVSEAARRFGSSTIVVSIEAKKQKDGGYEAYIDNGRERTGVEVFGWASRVAELGAGEILVVSIDREGTGMGFDVELTRKIADLVSIPVIASGGAGSVDDVDEVIRRGHADAVALASMPHYDFIAHHDPFEGEGAGEIGSAPTRHRFSKVAPTSIEELKKVLAGRGIDCQPGSWGKA
jgi:cyclase